MAINPDELQDELAKSAGLSTYRPDPTAPLTPAAGALSAGPTPESQIAEASRIPDYPQAVSAPTALGAPAASAPVGSDVDAFLAQHGITPGETARRYAQEPQAPPPPAPMPEEQGGFLGDVGRALGAGANVLGGGIVGLGNVLTRGALDRFGERVLGIPLSEQLAASAESYRQGFSPELQQARQAVEQAEGALGKVGAAVTNPRALLNMIVESAPSFVPGVGLAGLGAKAGGAMALARGATKEAAQRVARRSAVGTSIATEGGLGAGFAASEAGQAAREMEQSVLETSPNYQAYIAQGLTPEQAREEIALDAQEQAAAIAGPLAALWGTLGARLDANIATGNLARLGIAKALGGAIAREAAQEFGQEGSEQFAANVGTRLADPNQDYDEGVLEAGALGALAGGGVGGGMAAAGTASEALAQRAQRFQEQQAQQQEAQRVPPASPVGELGLPPEGTDPRPYIAQTEARIQQLEQVRQANLDAGVTPEALTDLDAELEAELVTLEVLRGQLGQQPLAGLARAMAAGPPRPPGLTVPGIDFELPAGEGEAGAALRQPTPMELRDRREQQIRSRMEFGGEPTREELDFLISREQERAAGVAIPTDEGVINITEADYQALKREGIERRMREQEIRRYDEIQAQGGPQTREEQALVDRMDRVGEQFVLDFAAPDAAVERPVSPERLESARQAAEQLGLPMVGRDAEDQARLNAVSERARQLESRLGVLEQARDAALARLGQAPPPPSPIRQALLNLNVREPQEIQRLGLYAPPGLTITQPVEAPFPGIEIAGAGVGQAPRSAEQQAEMQAALGPAAIAEAPAAEAPAPPAEPTVAEQIHDLPDEQRVEAAEQALQTAPPEQELALESELLVLPGQTSDAERRANQETAELLRLQRIEAQGGPRDANERAFVAYMRQQQPAAPTPELATLRPAATPQDPRALVRTDQPPQPQPSGLRPVATDRGARTPEQQLATRLLAETPVDAQTGRDMSRYAELLGNPNRTPADQWFMGDFERRVARGEIPLSRDLQVQLLGEENVQLREAAEATPIPSAAPSPESEAALEQILQRPVNRPPQGPSGFEEEYQRLIREEMPAWEQDMRGLSAVSGLREDTPALFRVREEIADGLRLIKILIGGGTPIVSDQQFLEEFQERRPDVVIPTTDAEGRLAAQRALENIWNQLGDVPIDPDLERYLVLIGRQIRVGGSEQFLRDFDSRLRHGAFDQISPELFHVLRGEFDERLQLREAQQRQEGTQVRQPPGTTEEGGGGDTGLGGQGEERLQPDERREIEEILSGQRTQTTEPGAETAGVEEALTDQQGEQAAQAEGGDRTEYGEGEPPGAEGGVQEETRQRIEQLEAGGQVPRETPGLRAALEELPPHAIDQVQNLPQGEGLELASDAERRQFLQQLEQTLQTAPPEQALALVEQRLAEATADSLTGFERGNDLRNATLARLQAQSDDSMEAAGLYIAADVHNLPGLNAELTETGVNPLIRQFSQIFREEIETALAGTGQEGNVTFHRQGGQMQAIIGPGVEPQAISDALFRAESRARELADAEGAGGVANPKKGRPGTGLNITFTPITQQESPAELTSRVDDELRGYAKQAPWEVGRDEGGRFPHLRAAIAAAPADLKPILQAMARVPEGRFEGEGVRERLVSAGAARRQELLSELEAEIEANPEQAVAIAEQELRRLSSDPLTGWVLGEAARDANLQSSIDFVTRTGRPGTYIAMDFGNLKGLTDEMVERNGGDKAAGWAEADNVFREVMVDIVGDRLTQAAPNAFVSFGRHGGDEFHAFIIDQHDPQALEDALVQINEEVQALSEDYEIADVPHTKADRAPGIRVIARPMPITPNAEVAEITQAAELQLEAAKKEKPDVTRQATEAAGAEPAAEPTQGAGPGAREAVAGQPPERGGEAQPVAGAQSPPPGGVSGEVLGERAAGRAEPAAAGGGGEPQTPIPAAGAPGSIESSFEGVKGNELEELRRRIPGLYDRWDRVEQLRDELKQLNRLLNSTEDRLPPEAVEGAVNKLREDIQEAEAELREVEPALREEIFDARDAMHRESQAARAESPLAQRMHRAIYSLAGNQMDRRVRIADIRDRFPDVSRQEFDQTLLAMQEQRKLVVYPEDDPQARDERDEAAAIDVGGVGKLHIVYLNEAPPTAAQTAARSAATTRRQQNQAVAQELGFSEQDVDYARRMLEVAERMGGRGEMPRTGTSWWGDNEILQRDVYDAGFSNEMSYDEWKDLLRRLRQQSVIALSRLDLVEPWNEAGRNADVIRNEVASFKENEGKQGANIFHLLRTVSFPRQIQDLAARPGVEAPSAETAPFAPGELVIPRRTAPEYVAPSAPSEEELEGNQGNYRLANAIYDHLNTQDKMTWQQFFKQANTAYGGTQAAGVYDAKQAYDAMELGFNQWVLTDRPNWAGLTNEQILERLQAKQEQLPTQTKASEKQLKFQQYSTPHVHSYVVAWAANIGSGDVILEPSAGTGNLATHAMNQEKPAAVYVNEVEESRRALLDQLPVSGVFQEDARHLHAVSTLGEIKPSVIVMNPPFSTNYKGGRKDSTLGVKHLQAALQKLNDGGRVVAILGKNNIGGTKAVQKLWASIRKQYNVRAVIEIDGKNYRKFGTTYDNAIVVIDKTGPTPGAEVTGRVTEVAELLPLLEGIRNDRTAPGTTAAEPGPAQPGGPGGAPGGGGQPGPGGAVSGAAGAVGPAAEPRGPQTPPAAGVEPSASGGPTGVPGSPPMGESRATAGTDAATGQPVQQASTAPVAPSGQTGSAGAGAVPSGEPPGTAAGGGPGSTEVAKDLGKTVKDPTPEPQQASEQASDVTTPPPPAESEGPGEFSHSTFQNYQAKNKLKGTKKHPTQLAETSAMASVTSPPLKYQPGLAQDIIRERLSRDQLDVISYAGQAHEQLLPNGSRRGFFIGDGTGVGKGREIAGIIADNWAQGRRKHVWVSENQPLRVDAQRDAEGVGLGKDVIFPPPAGGMAITRDEGVLYTTYDTLRSTSKEIKDAAGKVVTPAKSRLDQLVEWLGEDFDGVIAFDEAHNLKNAVPSKGARGTREPSKTALAAQELANRLPQARVVYVSATGATEVENLGYADRLGLWGQGTPFSDRLDFVEQVRDGGVAAMEVVAKDMKAQGLYLSRSLSFSAPGKNQSVEYDTLAHSLDADQRDMYDQVARAWQQILSEIDTILQQTGGAKNTRARSNAASSFWGAQQRFFNQFLIGLSTPSLISDIEKTLNSGQSAVLQLVNTNEKTQERRLKQAKEADLDLDEADLSPKDIMVQYLMQSFPVQLYEEKTDAEAWTVTVPVLDANGEPVLDPVAVERRDQLIEDVAALPIPEGVLEQLVDHFQPDNIAEVTGRAQRLVRHVDEDGTVTRTMETRTKKKAQQDADAFMAGKKRILVFSNAGGTGRSYHADRDAGNTERRVHYLVQAGWQADRAMQGLGRTHRTNQASAPVYKLVTTDVVAQQRFVSSIARRLDQLGALTRGSRAATSGGLFSPDANLENEYGELALESFIRDLYNDQLTHIGSRDEIAKALGYRLYDELGQQRDLNTSVPQFLNRLLAQELPMMDALFNDFFGRLSGAVEYARQQGTYDAGMETIQAKRITKLSESELVKHPSGGSTNYVQVQLTHDVEMFPFEKFTATDLQNVEFLRNKKSGRVYAIQKASSVTDATTGRILDLFRFQAVNGYDYRREDKFERSGFEVLGRDEAQQAWAEDLAKVPKERTETKHLITGAQLPVWDRLPSGTAKIYRMQTDAGEVVLGRDVRSKDINQVLKNMGHAPDLPTLTTEQYLERVQSQHATLTLANGWRIEPRRVSGEQRMELRGPALKDRALLKELGVTTEVINSTLRFFIPTNANAPAVFESVTQNRPVVEITGGAEPGDVLPSRVGSDEPVEQTLSTVGDITAALALTPQGSANLMQGEAPLVNVVQSVNDLPESLPADTRGAYINGRVYLVANNLTPKQANGVLLHELGVHYGLRQMLGPELYAEVQKQVRAQVASGSGRFVHAHNRALAGGVPGERQTPEMLGEETIAYLVEDHPNLPLVRRIIAAVRNFLRRLGIVRTVQAADLQQMAVAAVRAASRGERNRTSGSDAGPVTPAKEAGWGVDSDMHPTMLSRGGPRMPAAIDEAIGKLPRRSFADMMRNFNSDRRGSWLGLLTRQQVAEVAADVLPQAQAWQKMAQRMDAEARTLQSGAYEVAEEWQDLIGQNQTFGVGKANPDAKETADLMFDSTLARIDGDPDVPAPDPQADPARYRQWQQLNARFKKLSPAAQALYRKVRDKYREHYNATYKALVNRIERAEMDDYTRASTLDQLRRQFEFNRIEPYFPLKRFGDYWVYGAKEGEAPYYMMFESEREQGRAMVAMQGQGWTVKHGKHMKNLRAVDTTTPQFIKQVFDAVDKTSTGAEADAIKDDIYQLFLKTLPELSVRKQALHRQNREGFSEDALRGFASHMFHSSRQIARLNYSDQLREGLAQMRTAATQIDNQSDSNKAADVVRELDKRLDWMMNPDNAPISNVLTSIGFAWFLGLTPAAAFINLSQQAVVSFPMMATRFKNTTGVFNELRKANLQYVAAAAKRKFEQSKALGQGKSKREIHQIRTPAEYEKDYGGDVGKMIQELTDDGTLTLTNVATLAGIQDQENLGAGGKARNTFNKAINAVAYLFQGTEQMNREATAVAAYKLARREAKGKSREAAHEQALEVARRMVNGSHFDYTNANRARFMQGNTAKVLFLFKQYSQNMSYLMARQLYTSMLSRKASREERLEAAKLLSGILGMTTVMAGVTGLPLMGLAFGVSNAIKAVAGDEDEPWDAEHEFKLFLRDNLSYRVPGTDTMVGELADSGLLNAVTGMDFASRTSLAEMFFRAPDRELETKDLGGYWLEQLMGPLAGIGLNVFRGIDMMQDGHTQRGLETMAPKWIKDLSKSYRFGTEGALSLRGDPLYPEFSNWETFGTAVGFTPAALAERYEDNAALMKLQKQVQNRRRGLIDAFALAHKQNDGDYKEEVIDAITRFNSKWPEVPITMTTLRRSILGREKRSQEARHGVILDKKLRRRLLTESLLKEA